MIIYLLLSLIDVECGDLSAILSLLGQLKDHYHRMDMKEPV